jgi:hypothetical protein
MNAASLYATMHFRLDRWDNSCGRWDAQPPVSGQQTTGGSVPVGAATVGKISRSQHRDLLLAFQG